MPMQLWHGPYYVEFLLYPCWKSYLRLIQKKIGYISLKISSHLKVDSFESLFNWVVNPVFIQSMPYSMLNRSIDWCCWIL